MATTKVEFNGLNASLLPAIVADAVRELDINCRYDLSIKKHREKKTVSQNAYFHKLVDLLRVKMNWSFTHMKNYLIGSYGTILGDDCVMLTVAPEVMQEWERPHAKYIKTDYMVDAYGVEIEGHWYRLYKNVEDMSAYEMAVLIDGTVRECENLGMDVLTPDERAYLSELLKGCGNDT